MSGNVGATVPGYLANDTSSFRRTYATNCCEPEPEHEPYDEDCVDLYLNPTTFLLGNQNTYELSYKCCDGTNVTNIINKLSCW